MQNDKLLLKVFRRCAEVRNADDFLDLIEGPVAALLSHEIMIAGIGEVSEDGNFSQRYLNRGYPLAYFQALQKTGGKIDSPLLQRWRKTLQPVVFQSGRDDHLFPADWVALFNNHELQNVVGHGVLDLSGSISSYFIFSRLAHEAGAREIEILDLITPNLHNALARVAASIPVQAKNPAPSARHFSARQLEILALINAGKSNWEISQIIGTSESNVKYHIDQIFQKLGVYRRHQAVASARNLGLLSSAGRQVVY
ncbi:hypothetical protein BH11PSE11_BH11PSE11_19070 [soil metagenome]